MAFLIKLSASFRKRLSTPPTWSDSGEELILGDLDTPRHRGNGGPIDRVFDWTRIPWRILRLGQEYECFLNLKNSLCTQSEIRNYLVLRSWIRASPRTDSSGCSYQLSVSVRDGSGRLTSSLLTCDHEHRLGRSRSVDAKLFEPSCTIGFIGKRLQEMESNRRQVGS